MEKQFQKSLVILRIKFKIMKRTAILTYLIPCIVGSCVYTIIFTSKFNSIPSFSISWIDSLLLFFFLFFWSIILFLPFGFFTYYNFKNYNKTTNLIKKLNLSYLLYYCFIYGVITYFTKSFIEGLEILITYFLTGIISFNMYLKNRQ
jgi:hypothetical protein